MTKKIRIFQHNYVLHCFVYGRLLKPWKTPSLYTSENFLQRQLYERKLISFFAVSTGETINTCTAIWPDTTATISASDHIVRP